MQYPRAFGRWQMNGKRSPAGLRVLAVAALALCGCPESTPSIDAGLPAPEPLVDSSLAFANILDLEGVPAQTEDWSVFSMSDLGSWQTFGLAEASQLGAFSGPFNLFDGRWLSPGMLGLGLSEGPAATTLDFGRATEVALTSYPGRLEQRFVVDGLSVQLDLRFVTSRSALVSVSVVNQRAAEAALDVSWRGSLFQGVGTFSSNRRGVQANLSSGMVAAVSVLNGAASRAQGQDYVIEGAPTLHIAPGKSGEHHAVVTLAFGADELAAEMGSIDAVLEDPAAHVERSVIRWNQYLAKTDGGSAYREVAVKSLQTLVTNWRSPAGALLHDGLFPSYAIWYFNGFWAWDSWKHAAAVARFDVELAKQQIRTMYAYQDADGMIPDVIYFDRRENNLRNTKPPLSAWAIWSTAQQSGDVVFVEEMYEPLVRYHRWWYRARDNDGDGLCEYGSTDGTLIAAKWESGMDNAVRFDDATMVSNGGGNWSMDRESVDLNAYLYAEKRFLAQMATALGKTAEADAWNADAAALKIKINAEMFDPVSGYYYDLLLDGSDLVRLQGPEGWIPLWAGVAGPTEAEAVRRVIVNPEKFATFIPFPTLGRDQPGFSDGYWRGLVWLDQAYFGIVGLQRYGFAEDAAALTASLFEHLGGLVGSQAPIRENYHPLTGAGQNANHFSWSAAHLLMLQMDAVGLEAP